MPDPGLPLGRGGRRGVHIHADVPREAPTVRGFISLLARTLEGAAPADVAEVPDDLLDQLGLSETLGMTRTQGLTAILLPDQALRGRRRLMLGVLELAGAAAGFSAAARRAICPTDGDVHVGERLIRQYELRAGDEIDGETPARRQGPRRRRWRRSPPSSAGRPHELARAPRVHPPRRHPSQRAAPPRVPAGPPGPARLHQPGDRPPLPARQGPARPHRGAGQGGQDDGAPVHRRGHRAPTTPRPTLFILLVDERPEEVFEMEAAGRRRGDRLELRQPGARSTSRWPS